jgi:hypothetical protein
MISCCFFLNSNGHLEGCGPANERSQALNKQCLKFNILSTKRKNNKKNYFLIVFTFVTESVKHILSHSKKLIMSSHFISSELIKLGATNSSLQVNSASPATELFVLIPLFDVLISESMHPGIERVSFQASQINAEPLLRIIPTATLLFVGIEDEHITVVLHELNHLILK